MEKRVVYADNAATTKTDPRVLEAFVKASVDCYGNPSSLYSGGREARAALERAREKIAGILGCAREELYFTSGGTESDNWAIRGTAAALEKKGKHIVTSKIEHHAVLHLLNAMEKRQGYEVTYLDVYEDGIVRPQDLRDALREDTVLATVMHANNEIGTVQPIRELASAAHEWGVPFFTDAVQAVGHIDVDVKELGVDLLAFSGHKFHAPKGIGALYIKKGTKITNLLEGGGQERKRRSGTENVPGAVALALALELAVNEEGLRNRERTRSLRDGLLDKLLTLPHVRLNGSRTERLPGNINISCEFIEGEGLILWLDLMGIAASTGSACSTASLDPSHVLLAIGLPHEIAHGSLRITLDHTNTREDADYIYECVKHTLEKLRAMSPLYDRARGGEKEGR